MRVDKVGVVIARVPHKEDRDDGGVDPRTPSRPAGVVGGLPSEGGSVAGQ